MLLLFPIAHTGQPIVVLTLAATLQELVSTLDSKSLPIDVANMISGDWVFDFTNCCPPTTTPLSVVSVSQSSASKINRIDPIPLEPGQESYIPSNSAVDPENNMMYVRDGGAGKIVGLKYDPVSGNMTVAWTGNQSTLAFLSLIGPTDQRVLVGTDMAPNTTISQMANNPPPAYAERVMWRDATTGRLLAASDYFSGMSAGPQLQASVASSIT
jgi:hypothetical protein